MALTWAVEWEWGGVTGSRTGYFTWDLSTYSFLRSFERLWDPEFVPDSMWKLQARCHDSSIIQAGKCLRQVLIVGQNVVKRVLSPAEHPGYLENLSKVFQRGRFEY